MSFQKTVMWIFVKVNTDLFLKRRFKLTFQVTDKLRYPAIVLVVFLAVGDEDIVFVTGDETGHSDRDLHKFRKEVYTSQIYFHSLPDNQTLRP